MMRLIMTVSYLALRWVRVDAITEPFFVASTSTVQFPAIGGCPLPAYIWREATHGSSKEFFISGMFIEGIAGMMSVTVTRASLIGLPLASIRFAWNGLSSPPLSGSVSA
jgi:hypothetical protein